MKMTTIITAIFFMLAIIACNKKNDSLSKTEMLTTGTWKITSIMADADGNGSYESDELSSLPVCFKDNFFTFKANGVFEMNEGALKCDPADPQIETTSWSLTQNETRLTIDGDEYIIDGLNNTTLRIKEDAATFGSMVTLTRQ